MTTPLHITVAAVVETEGRYLLVEEIIDGRYVINQPAGHVEPGESLTEAVIRETLEETGYRFQPQALLGVYRWQHPRGDTYFRFTFAGDVEALPGRVLDDDIEQVLWWDYPQLLEQQDRLRSPLVLAAVRDHRAGARFPLDCLQDLVSATL